MNDKDLNNKVTQTLNIFERIQDIEPSSDWNQLLMSRLASTKQNSNFVIPSSKLSAIIIFFIIINLGIIINIFKENSHESFSRNKELQVISKELLINPISTNNLR